MIYDRTTTMNLAEFAEWALKDGSFHGCGLDGGDIQDKALECGIIVQALYDPEKHGPCADAEVGEVWFVFSDEIFAALQRS